jgi:hypothetical protein
VIPRFFAILLFIAAFVWLIADPAGVADFVRAVAGGIGTFFKEVSK